MIIYRLISACIVMIGVSTITFGLLHIVPGDPVEVMLGESASFADRESLRTDLGLDKPIFRQWLDFQGNLLTLDLGTSLYSKKPISALVAERAPWTAALALASLVVALLIAVPLGTLAALRVGTYWDALASSISLIGVSIPNFLFGPLLIIVLSIWAGWFPTSGNESFSSIVLPAVTLGASLAAILSRMIRASLLGVLGEEFVVAARARGLSKTTVLFKHVYPNAALPVLTIIGLQLGALLGGAVITEIIFSWPGIGQLLIEGIQRRDYPVVQACVLLVSFVYVAVNMLTDVAYSHADPRISFGR
ncbi:MAG: ABC transporter permease [Gammaproteobacteria bacterium]